MHLTPIGSTDNFDPETNNLLDNIMDFSTTMRVPPTSDPRHHQDNCGNTLRFDHIGEESENDTIIAIEVVAE